MWPVPNGLYLALKVKAPVHSPAQMLLHSSGCRGSLLFRSGFPFPATTTRRNLRALTTVAATPNMYRGGRGGGGGTTSQRGRGRGRGGGGRGGRGGGGGGRGEQRWWDPQWRAERLRQMAGEVRALLPCVAG